MCFCLQQQRLREREGDGEREGKREGDQNKEREREEEREGTSTSFSELVLAFNNKNTQINSMKVVLETFCRLLPFSLVLSLSLSLFLSLLLIFFVSLLFLFLIFSPQSPSFLEDAEHGCCLLLLCRLHRSVLG